MGKHILSFFFFLFVCAQMNVKATAQAGEMIIIGNDTLVMFTCPIEANPTLRKLVSNRTVQDYMSTGCWRGYIGIWRQQDNKLYLEKIINRCGERPYTYLSTDSIFDEYKDEHGRIFASWFTGNMRIVKGKCIRYIHDGYDSLMEYETICEVKNGIVTSQKEYHNYIKKAYYDYHNYYVIDENFNGDLFPELANKQLEARIKILPDVHGRIDSLYISLQVNNKKRESYPSDHPYIKELMRCIRLVPDWQVNFLYGEIKWTNYDVELWNKKGCKAQLFGEHTPDSIYYNDSVYILKQLPLQYDTRIYAKLRPVLNSLFSKENQRGYTATWELKNNHLYLKRIYLLNSSKPFPIEIIYPEFKLDQEIKATWFDGKLNLTYGKTLKEYREYYPMEIDYEVEKGKIKSTRIYRNYLTPRDSCSYANCPKKLQALDWSKYLDTDEASVDISYTIWPALNGKATKIELELDKWEKEKGHSKINDTDMERKCCDLLKRVRWEVLYYRGEVLNLYDNVYIKKVR